MRSSPSRTVTLILLLLIAVTIWWWQMEKVVVPSSIEQAGTNQNGMQASPSPSPEEKGQPSARGKRPDLPKSGSAGLSEGQGEEIASSAVHTRIPAGHSMVTGGYQTEDGHYEFVVLTPKWLEAPSGKKQILLESKVLNVDQEALVSTGLNSLVTGEQKLQQNGEVWTPEDVTRTLTETKGLNQLSSPSMVVNPGGSAQVQIGNEKTSFMLNLEASEAPDGGFELKSDIKRLK